MVRGGNVCRFKLRPQADADRPEGEHPIASDPDVTSGQR
jgi:hypothetical protein